MNKQSVERIIHDTAVMNQFVTLGGECLRDGNMYGAVIGAMPEGCAAFEKTRAHAIIVCMSNFHNEEAKVPELPAGSFV